MYKAIITDDHVPVIEYLTAMIPWQDLGLELVEACSSGEEALQACKLHPPDLLITDIGMPIMDGLQLIEEAKKINPDLKTVILSCHEDFQYAQRAVKLNATDYILKETMRIEQITEVLRNLIRQMDNEKAEKKGRQKLQDVVFQNMSSLRTDFLRTLIDNPIWNEAEWSLKAESLEIPIAADTHYLPVLCMPDRYQEFELRFGGRHQIHFVIENALNEAVKIEGSVVLALDEQHYFIIYPFPKTIKWNVLEGIKNELSSVQKDMKRYLKVPTSYYFGEKSKSIIELKAQIVLLLNGNNFRFYSGEQIIARLKPVELTTEDIFVHYTEALHDFRDTILTQNEDEIHKVVTKWMDHISSCKYPVESVRSYLLKIVTDIELKYTVMQHFLTNYNAVMLQKAINSMDTLEHLSLWLIQFLLGKMELVKAQQNQSIRKEIVAAQRYVMMHLNEKISMEELAIKLELNPSHFSRIFKKETGETFVEFVTNRKMERARELLDQSDKSVEVIAEELGFDNSSYFFKLFRGFMGMTPTEYRKRI
ncbi:helix-turn-helix domain-containing protein [Cohnella endophytica]|uniref:Helix-turn-helix domain-containing protein n=1 Tax=Cohnella endophytica TaxID=2419778 RepID=A0A494Y671_9BACL|nr:helix-turn-helix domain-containing protein [Cohnella endophytica]RKP58169.1 helix-turn-helix domain-containing protein [Cohnella endophytica]